MIAPNMARWRREAKGRRTPNLAYFQARATQERRDRARLAVERIVRRRLITALAWSIEDSLLNGYKHPLADAFQPAVEALAQMAEQLERWDR